MGETIVVTGGAGFLGSYVTEKLKERGHEVFVPRTTKYDLRRRKDVYRMYEDFEPEAVIHLAAQCGGIGINQKKPASFLYDNAVMGLELMDAAVARVRKFVQVGTVCSYPKFTPVPFKETDIHNGYPEETNAPYGLAKKLLLTAAQSYRQQYGLNAIYLIPVNLYGPRDNFDPFTSHVIPALIRKIVIAHETGSQIVDIWGTGEACREFLYVDDAADAIVAAYEQYDGSEPVNIGSGETLSIYSLARMIAELVGYAGIFRFDPSKPDGQPKRQLDVTRAKELFGFEASTTFRDGLRRTIDWYESSHRYCQLRGVCS
jgi:GDP-L-fucose synthase